MESKRPATGIDDIRWFLRHVVPLGRVLFLLGVVGAIAMCRAADFKTPPSHNGMDNHGAAAIARSATVIAYALFSGLCFLASAVAGLTVTRDPRD